MKSTVPALIASLIVSTGLLGCGTKAADCEAFTKVVNTNVDTMKKADPKDGKAFAAMFASLATAAKGVAVKDPGIVPLVKEYVDAAEKAAAAAKNMESADPNVLTKTLADLEASEKAESAVVDKINAYCK